MSDPTYVANVPLVLSQVFPTAMPQANTLAVFGLLLAFGVLGGLLAARAKWLPSITGFTIFGVLVGPSGFGSVITRGVERCQCAGGNRIGFDSIQDGRDHPPGEGHARPQVVSQRVSV